MIASKEELPEWLTGIEYSELKSHKAVRQSHHNYLEKTLLEIQIIMTENLQQARLLNRDRFIDKLLPRAKLLGVCALIITAAIVKTFYALLMLNVLIILAAAAVGIKFYGLF